jgi:DNA-binding transcriptional ArsR family regulator
MSIRAIAWALQQKTGSPVSKLVLIKLADNSNDKGACWPSISHIAEHTELSERAIRENIRKLEELGLVETRHRQVDGVSLSNWYILRLPGGVRQEAQGGTAPYAGGGGAPGAPKPSSLEPSLNRHKRDGADAPIELPLWLSKELWESFKEHRKSMKAPMTLHAERLGIEKLITLHAAGQNIEAVIKQSIFNHWQGLFAVKNEHIPTPPPKRSAPIFKVTHRPLTPEERAENQRRIRELTEGIGKKI